jgi:hypothetical protein
MGKAWWFAPVACLLGVCANEGHAQETGNLRGEIVSGSGDVHAQPPSLALPPSQLEREEADGEAYFSANLLLGMFTGVRGQAAVYRGDRQSALIELFYGGMITKIGSSETAGIGARYYWRRCGRMNSLNSLLIGPGLAVYSHFKNNSLLVLSPTLDLCWLHGFENGAGWETGLNLGVGFGLMSNEENDKHVGGATPLISIYTGLRY